MKGFNELRINCLARPEAARPMRYAMAAFLAASGKVAPDRSEDILTAVGEALANAVEHAYKYAEGDEVELFARIEADDSLSVHVFDRETFIDHKPVEGRGFGLRIVEAIAQEFSVTTGNGTHVRMSFKAEAK